jgi:hypothetical protein
MALYQHRTRLFSFGCMVSRHQPGKSNSDHGFAHQGNDNEAIALHSRDRQRRWAMSDKTNPNQASNSGKQGSPSGSQRSGQNSIEPSRKYSARFRVAGVIAVTPAASASHPDNTLVRRILRIDKPWKGHAKAGLVRGRGIKYNGSSMRMQDLLGDV